MIDEYQVEERRKHPDRGWSFWKDVLASIVGVCLVVMPVSGTIISWVNNVEKRQAVQEEKFESFKELMRVQEISHLQQNSDLDSRMKDLRSDIRDVNQKIDRLLQATERVR